MDRSIGVALWAAQATGDAHLVALVERSLGAMEPGRWFRGPKWIDRRRAVTLRVIGPDDKADTLTDREVRAIRADRWARVWAHLGGQSVPVDGWRGWAPGTVRVRLAGGDGRGALRAVEPGDGAWQATVRAMTASPMPPPYVVEVARIGAAEPAWRASGRSRRALLERAVARVAALRADRADRRQRLETYPAALAVWLMREQHGRLAELPRPSWAGIGEVLLGHRLRGIDNRGTHTDHRWVRQRYEAAARNVEEIKTSSNANNLLRAKATTRSGASSTGTHTARLGAPRRTK